MENRNRFSFSAASIQDFLDCERRFELKYMLEQSWPAVASEPLVEIEENIRKGNKFHFLIHQFFSGISETALLNSIDEPEVMDWFNSFRSFYKTIQIEKAFSEFHLTNLIGEAHLTAVFDLVYLTADNTVGIIDWKTSHFVPKKSTLAKKVQTILYPYMVKETFHEFLPGCSLLPENISMRYWYPHAPHADFIFNYGQSTHAENHTFLENVIGQILSKKVGEFKLTPDANKCAYCQYRSLCDRGISAGNIFQMDAKIGEKNEILVDFDQLPELWLDD